MWCGDVVDGVVMWHGVMWCGDVVCLCGVVMVVLLWWWWCNYGGRCKYKWTNVINVAYNQILTRGVIEQFLIKINTKSPTKTTLLPPTPDYTHPLPHPQPTFKLAGEVIELELCLLHLRLQQLVQLISLQHCHRYISNKLYLSVEIVWWWWRGYWVNLMSLVICTYSWS